MKNKILLLFVSFIALAFAGCTENNDGPLVTPPSWKGFNYVVKRAVQDGQAGEYVQIERAPLLPGDEIKVYAVRKNRGSNIGQVSGDIHLRYTLYPEKGDVISGTISNPVTSLANNSFDGWEDPYATFTLPSTDMPYEYFKVEVACQFYFKAFGNQNSEVDYSDQTHHEEPYIGNIYTDFANFHPMNGSSANSGNYGGGLQYHTIHLYRR